MKNIISAFLFLLSLVAFAQEITVSGKITDETNAPVEGATVSVKGSTTSTTTNAQGEYSISARLGAHLEISHQGFEMSRHTVRGEVEDISITSNQLRDVVVLGSRGLGRTPTETVAPIDVIGMADISSQAPQSNINQILNVVAPSFTSNTQTVADGTDHIDPAQLRGLGPDQVLVLINGKRRHTTSLVNINGTPGRGSVGTDLNAITAFAVDRIEILRDGASAQYGSDAIAGVINLNLKKATERLDVNVYEGGYMTKGANDHRGGFDGNNFQIDANYGTELGKDKSFINITGNLQQRDAASRANDYPSPLYNGYNAIEYRASQAGTNINALFGNINNTLNTDNILSEIKKYAPQVSYLTAEQQSSIFSAQNITEMQSALKFDATENELKYRGLERRNFNMRVGQSLLKSGQFFLNSAYPFNNKLEAYLFGGTSYRKGSSAGFYRRPNDVKDYTALYPNGFLPQIESSIGDASIAAGLRGKIFENWNFDLSNTFGRNSFAFTITNTANVTMREKSPTSFDAGSMGFSQNTINLDLSRKFDVLNVAFGAEQRHENFSINAGVPDSYNIYDINGDVVTATTPDNLKVTDFFGNVRAGGAQVFPGYRPSNVVDEGRNSFAVYADLEAELFERWLVEGAVRNENYSDFGNTTNFKLATRLKMDKNINLRAALATGFRAPSLHQIYFNSTSTQFTQGVANEIGTFRNDSEVAKALGIPQLKQEESQSFSFGATAKIPEVKVTIAADAYIINIKDRVVVTDQFVSNDVTKPYFEKVGAEKAIFFANAIDTQTMGLDLVVSNIVDFGGGASLKNDLASSLSQTKKVGDIKASDLLKQAGQINNYFSETSRIYIEEAIPREKTNLSNTLSLKKIDISLRNSYFGEVTDPNAEDVNGDGYVGAIIVNGKAVENEHPVYGARIITDLSFGYRINKNIKWIIGTNNIFDIYPDRNLGVTSARRPKADLDSNGNIVYNEPTKKDLSYDSQFVYSRNVSQFGFNGRLVFTRLSFTF